MTVAGVLKCSAKKSCKTLLSLSQTIKTSIKASKQNYNKNKIVNLSRHRQVARQFSSSYLLIHSILPRLIP